MLFEDRFCDLRCCLLRKAFFSPFYVFIYSADGNYEVTLMTKATVYYTGLVVWQPPAVYKSSCSIDVEFFPYDVQTCVLKLGSWTYDGFKVTTFLNKNIKKKDISNFDLSRRKNVVWIAHC